MVCEIIIVLLVTRRSLKDYFFVFFYSYGFIPFILAKNFVILFLYPKFNIVVPTIFSNVFHISHNDLIN